MNCVANIWKLYGTGMKQPIVFSTYKEAKDVLDSKYREVRNALLMEPIEKTNTSFTFVYGWEEKECCYFIKEERM